MASWAGRMFWPIAPLVPSSALLRGEHFLTMAQVMQVASLALSDAPSCHRRIQNRIVW
jgi:hypothetical protein